MRGEAKQQLIRNSPNFLSDFVFVIESGGLPLFSAMIFLHHVIIESGVVIIRSHMSIHETKVPLLPCAPRKYKG